MNSIFARIALAALLVTGVAASRAEATPINLAPIYGTASASSETYGAASLAIDNNLNTTYAGGSIFQTGQDQNASWAVDLGQNYGLTSINIYQRTDEVPRMLNDFTVTVFDALGNVNYTQNFAPNPGDTVSTPFTITFASVITGKAVQILLDSASADYLALAEVQVFGEVPEPASLALLTVGLVGIAGLRRRMGAKAA